MAPTISSPANLHIPTNEDLSRLADLARVPQEQREKFSNLIIDALLDLHATSKRPHNEKAVSDAVEAAQNLLKQIVGLDPRDRERLVDQSFEDEINRFLEVAYDYKQFYRPRRLEISSNQKRGRGRPKGVVNPRLHRLVLDLRFISKRQLSFDRYSREGPLIEALELLRPYAPPGVVPPGLPYAAIWTWIRDDNKTYGDDRARTKKNLSRTGISKAKIESILDRHMGPPVKSGRKGKFKFIK